MYQTFAGALAQHYVQLFGRVEGETSAHKKGRILLRPLSFTY